VTPATEDRARRGALVLTVVVLAVLGVLAGALGAVAATRASHRHALDSARRDAVTAATDSLATVLSYDYRHLDRDFARSEAQLTPGFKGKYDQTIADGVRPLAGKYKVVVTAQVTAAAPVQGDADRVVVLAFVSQTVTNTQLTAPRLDRPRMNVTMVHKGDRWLIGDINPI
jgi:Mce-associated membrane protein